MKPSVNETLSNVLGVEVIPAGTKEVATQPAEIMPSGNPDKDMLYDFNVSRRTMHTLIEKSNHLVDCATIFAEEKQDARSVEAAAMAQREARENVMALVGLHKTRKEIERVSNQPAGDTNITQNAVFVGTTGDLLKFTKEMNADGLLKDALKTIETKSEKPHPK